MPCPRLLVPCFIESSRILEPKKENEWPANHANHAKQKGVAEPEQLPKKGPTLIFGVFQKLFSYRVVGVVRGQPIPVSRLNVSLLRSVWSASSVGNRSPFLFLTAC